MPVDWSRYPKDWKAVVERIRLRSGDKCEWCGAPNHAFIIRRPGTIRWHIAPEGHLVDALVGLGYKLTKVILTTAHIGAPHPDGQWVTIAQLPKLPPGQDELDPALLAAIYKGYLNAVFYQRLPHGETIGDILFREDYKLHDAILGVVMDPL